MSHADHPGFDAPNCPARMTIYRSAYSPTSDGYSCKVTGGHCLPGSNCPKLLEILKAKDKETFDRINKRQELIQERNKLIAIANLEKGSPKSRKIMDKVSKIDDDIMMLTSSEDFQRLDIPKTHVDYRI